MIHEMNRYLAEKDPAVAAAIQAEFDREANGLELIASENVVSEAVLLAAAGQQGPHVLHPGAEIQRPDALGPADLMG